MLFIIIVISLTVSLTVTMGCIWRRLRTSVIRSKSTSYDNTSNANKNDKDIENTIRDKDNSKVPENNLNTGANGHRVSQVEPVARKVDDSENQNLDPLSSLDEAMNACLKAAESLETLEHINKSRPRRSNIRRSTRKQKESSESNLSNHNKDGDNFDQNNVKEDRKSKDLLKEQISSTLSMFSARIEEVTKPLSPSTPNRQKEFKFDVRQSNENLSTITITTTTAAENSSEDVVKPQTSLIDRTKKIGNPLLSSAMFAELKLRQNKSNKTENTTQIDAKLSVDQISDCNENSVQRID